MGISNKNWNPQIDIYSKVSYVSNGDHMWKFWPVEVYVPIYPN